MATRMIHPKHGATHAYDVTEIQRLQADGWSVEVPEVKAPEPAPEPEPEKRKPGRPPKAQ
jgi:hypothetical protein